MTACGTKPTSRHVCADVRFRWEERKSYVRGELFRFLTQNRRPRLWIAAVQLTAACHFADRRFLF
jgi:hypothetical protein